MASDGHQTGRIRPGATAATDAQTRPHARPDRPPIEPALLPAGEKKERLPAPASLQPLCPAPRALHKLHRQLPQRPAAERRPRTPLHCLGASRHTGLRRASRDHPAALHRIDGRVCGNLFPCLAPRPRNTGPERQALNLPPAPKRRLTRTSAGASGRNSA
ncbi:hypothetical protein GCM10011341_21480 [Frigidibacter albus]|nr:hypothetical protein GCM10011341_21480 [Frigidibacter albus]